MIDLRAATKKVLPLAAVALVCLSSVALAATRSDGSKPAPPAVSKGVQNVPVKTLDRIGAGQIGGKDFFTRLGEPEKSPGKVRVLTVNAAWCPHCAANSWPLAVALSRFGSFSGLRVIDTGDYYGEELNGKPAYPNTQGLSFLKARYKSSLVKLDAVVLADRNGKKLERPSGADVKLIKRFNPRLGVPALVVGDVLGRVGSGYDPGLLAKKSAKTITKSVANPSSKLAKAVDGEANVITAGICAAAGQAPAAVCEAPGVKKAAARLP